MHKGNLPSYGPSTAKQSLEPFSTETFKNLNEEGMRGLPGVPEAESEINSAMSDLAGSLRGGSRLSSIRRHGSVTIPKEGEPNPDSRKS